MRVFIAGVMQGTRHGKGMAAQDYRARIARVLREFVPDVEIVDPNLIHPHGVDYGRQKASQVLVEMAELAAEVDCLVAYVPEASMGTAVEMWQAYRAGIPVYTVSPLTENWVVFTLSTELFAGLDEFDAFVAQGGLDRSRGVG